MTEMHWCDDCGETHPVTSRAGRDLCRGCADQYDAEHGRERARYRNPPDYYAIGTARGMGSGDAGDST